MGRREIKGVILTFAATSIAASALAEPDPPKETHSWIDNTDYPTKAVADSKTGVAKVQFDVTEKGRGENCLVLESSGSAELDRQSCAAILRSPFLKIAKDEQGHAIRSVQTRKVDWSKNR